MHHAAWRQHSDAQRHTGAAKLASTEQRPTEPHVGCSGCKSSVGSAAAAVVVVGTTAVHSHVQSGPVQSSQGPLGAGCETVDRATQYARRAAGCPRRPAIEHPEPVLAGHVHPLPAARTCTQVGRRSGDGCPECRSDHGASLETGGSSEISLHMLVQGVPKFKTGMGGARQLPFPPPP